MTTCSTCSGSTAARSSAASIAVPPSSVASSVESPPPILPIGVRALPRITVLGMGTGLSSGRWEKFAWEDGNASDPAIVLGRCRSPRQHSQQAPPTRTPSLCRLRGRARARRQPRPRRRRCWPRARHAERSSRSRWPMPTASAGCSSDSASASASRPSARAWSPPPCAGAHASSRPSRCAGRLPERRRPEIAAALVEGTMLADYRFDRHKSAPRGGPRGAAEDARAADRRRFGGPRAKRSPRRRS